MKSVFVKSSSLSDVVRIYWRRERFGFMTSICQSRRDESVTLCVPVPVRSNELESIINIPALLLSCVSMKDSMR